MCTAGYAKMVEVLLTTRFVKAVGRRQLCQKYREGFILFLLIGEHRTLKMAVFAMIILWHGICTKEDKE